MSETRLLSEIATLQYGGAFSSKAFNREGQGLPLIRIRDVQRGYSETYFDGEYNEKYLASDGDFLISMDGSFTLGEWRGGKALLNQRVCLIRDTSDEVDLRYLVAILPRYLSEIEARTPFVTVKHLSAKALNAIEIPLPDLQEQKRIADQYFLQKLIEEKRERQQALFEELQKSVFVETFGNPVTNSKSLPLVKLGDLGTLDRGISKHRPRNAPELLGGPYPLIQTGDVANSGGLITSYTSTYSELGLQQSKIWPAGTLCITIAANIAKTGILTFDACFPDSVVGFTSTPEKTLYVKFILDFLQEILEASAPQSAQKNINLNILRNLAIPSPELEDLIEFSTKIKSIQI